MIKWVVMFLLFTAGNKLLAQQTFDKKKLNDLKPGMSEIQIKQYLGDPIKFENFATVKRNTFDTTIYWRYADDAIVVVTNHLFDRVEKNKEELLKFIQQNASRKDGSGFDIINYGKN
jgi:hypothetical protein